VSGLEGMARSRLLEERHVSAGCWRSAAGGASDWKARPAVAVHPNPQWVSKLQPVPPLIPFSSSSHPFTPPIPHPPGPLGVAAATSSTLASSRWRGAGSNHLAVRHQHAIGDGGWRLGASARGGKCRPSGGCGGRRRGRRRARDGAGKTLMSFSSLWPSLTRR
jgi:hypothetical protein